MKRHAITIISFLVAIYLQFVHEALGFAPIGPSAGLVAGVAITTVGWVSVVLLTPPSSIPGSFAVRNGKLNVGQEQYGGYKSNLKEVSTWNEGTDTILYCRHV